LLPPSIGDNVTSVTVDPSVDLDVDLDVDLEVAVVKVVMIFISYIAVVMRTEPAFLPQ